MLALMYFSPTHTTKKIVSAVGKVFFEKMLSKMRLIDVTPLSARLREYTFSEDDVLVFGAPVYGGRVPVLLRDLFENLQGNGTRAIALCVYGNRDYDDALLETCDLLSSRGFTVCAASAFIGEHSYTEKVGSFRPDKEDLLAADEFARAAFEKVAAGIPVRKRVHGHRPYKELSTSLIMPKKAPVVSKEKCTHCSACVSVCPVCNLSADLKDLGRCVGCAACVRFCPAGARELCDESIAAAKARLEANCTARRNPEFFL